MSEMTAPPGVFFEELADGFTARISTRSIGEGLVLLLIVGGLLAFAIAQSKNGHIDPLFLSFVSIGLGSQLAILLVGHVNISLSEGTLRVFTGIGSIGWSHLMDWNHVHEVEEIRGRRGAHFIAIHGLGTAKFGRYLNDESRSFVLQVLRRELAKRP
jgi:hypothetical protein